ncbi:MAG: NDP-sugar synthase [Firmicutes bacterium]|nr:NDP-sugar synthase [Bacillota bacterium]
MGSSLPIIGWGLAAGEGRRLAPLTLTAEGHYRSKAMVSFLGRPILAWQLDAFAAAGLRRCYLVTRGEFNREPVRAYFGYRYRHVDLAYSESIWDRCDTGSADATLRHAARLRVDQPLLVFPTDSLFSVDLGALYRFHLTRQAEVTIATMLLPAEAIDGRYGVVFADLEGRVEGFWEKPSAAELSLRGGSPIPGGWLTNIGLYLIDPDLLLRLDRDREIRAMRRRRLDFGLDLIPWLVEHGHRVFAYGGASAGDLGNLQAFLKTMEAVLTGEFPLARPRPPHGWAHLAPRIHPTAIIRNSWVAPDAVIGPYACVESSYLGEGMVVGSHAQLRRVHAGADSFIGAAARIKDTVLGTAVRVHSRRPQPTVIDGWSGLGDAAEVGAGIHLSGTVVLPGEVVEGERPSAPSKVSVGA